MTDALEAELLLVAAYARDQGLNLAADYITKKANGHFDIIDDPTPQGVWPELDDEVEYVN